MSDTNGYIRILKHTVQDIWPLHLIFQHISGKRRGSSSEIKGCTPEQAVGGGAEPWLLHLHAAQPEFSHFGF